MVEGIISSPQAQFESEKHVRADRAVLVVVSLELGSAFCGFTELEDWSTRMEDFVADFITEGVEMADVVGRGLTTLRPERHLLRAAALGAAEAGGAWTAAAAAEPFTSTLIVRLALFNTRIFCTVRRNSFVIYFNLFYYCQLFTAIIIR